MIEGKKVRCIIPIKGHSERVPRKNFRKFNGKPLFHHILISLDETEEVDEIIINTDSEEIATEAPKVSKKVIVMMRPKELCGDFVSVNKLIEYEVRNMSEEDIIFQTHVTNPLLNKTTISSCINAFVRNLEINDSLFTVNKFQSRFFTHKGEAINHDPKELIRTQDLNPVFEENSCIYMFTKKAFYIEEKRIGKNPMLFETASIESLDIDDEIDFKTAEIFHKNLHLFNKQKA